MLGLLGALDPYKRKVNIGMIKIQQDTGVALICITENKSDDTGRIFNSLKENKKFVLFYSYYIGNELIFSAIILAFRNNNNSMCSYIALMRIFMHWRTSVMTEIFFL